VKKEFRLKGSEKILGMIRAFSATERVVFGFLTLIALVSALVMAWKVNKSFLVPMPSHGGSFTEGIIGLPRSVNPVLAFTDVDKDLSNLVYSGLMKYEGNDLVPDLAKEYSISDDGLVYRFVLKDNLRFHDGTQLTTDDVEFTLQKVQDDALKSPRRVDWASVVIRKISPLEIEFVLKQPYAPFLSNTTLGILPKHIWNNVGADQFIFSQYNIEPIGSGPYEVSTVKRDGGGIPQYYVLDTFNRYHNEKPYISKITLHFYPNEKTALEAYDSGIIDNFAGVSPEEASMLASSIDSTLLHTPLPRIFGVFLNQNSAPVLANKEVRQALDMALDKEKIIEEVLYGYGVSIDSPLPIGTLQATTTQKTGDKDAAKSLLAKAGWLINAEGILQKKTSTGVQTLEFSISTTDAPDLKKTAEIIKTEWEDLGARITIKVFEYGDLSQNIIKTRKYDALLFGEVVGKDLDLYAFWHSSQRNAPGLNLSMYVNSKVDSILEDIRTTFNEEDRITAYRSFEKIIKDEVPAIFLYSPEYTYIVSNKIKGINLESITNASDRWYGVDKWFITTDYVWKIFLKNNEQ
jgi:peptide/nickel transport system substrate-binding protein